MLVRHQRPPLSRADFSPPFFPRKPRLCPRAVMSAPAAPWPPSLVGTPTVAVIERAIERRRLSHSLLLHGDDLETLLLVAHAIADRLLNETVGGASRPDSPSASASNPSPAPHRFAPEQHPDCHALRPAGKMRQISAETTRNLISKVQVSGSVSQRKVAIIHEADRMNVAAANVFLKTLEEPPAHT